MSDDNFPQRQGLTSYASYPTNEKLKQGPFIIWGGGERDTFDFDVHTCAHVPGLTPTSNKERSETQ